MCLKVIKCDLNVYMKKKQTNIAKKKLFTVDQLYIWIVSNSNQSLCSLCHIGWFWKLEYVTTLRRFDI